MSRLVLLDVENTIIKDPKKDSRYLSEALLNVYGIITEGINLDDYEGMTSQEIVTSILLEKGFEQKIIDAKISQFMEEIQYSYYNVIGLDKLFQTDKILINGSREFLNAMQKEGVTIGIATGQLERIVKLKLERTELQKYFSVEAYGNEGKEISKILDVALEKSSTNASPVAKNQIFVIGSYPKIIQAAKSLGLIPIGISTGRYSAEDLKKAGASIVSKSINDRSVKNTIIA